MPNSLDPSSILPILTPDKNALPGRRARKQKRSSNLDQNSGIQNIWLILVIWSFIYVLDYALTIVFARQHKAHLHTYVRFEGSLELTPQFQKDVDVLRRVSPQFVMRWLISVVGLYAIWWLSVVSLKQPQFFYFLIGMLVLREVTVHLRHIRNLALYPIAKAGGLKGQIEYSRWSALKLSAVELLSFGGMYLILAIFLRSWFMAGGAFGCCVVGVQHWRMYKKALALSQTSQESLATPDTQAKESDNADQLDR